MQPLFSLSAMLLFGLAYAGKLIHEIWQFLVKHNLKVSRLMPVITTDIASNIW